MDLFLPSSVLLLVSGIPNIISLTQSALMGHYGGMIMMSKEPAPARVLALS